MNAAAIREELGLWWAQEFPNDALPTEALIRLSERLASDEIDRLAAFILREYPHEPGRTGISESAVDVAIRLLR